MAEHVVVEADGEAVALEDFDEAAGRQQAELGALPADEGLRADEGMRGEVVFRLVPDFKFLSCKRFGR